jgi:hypothetical protein
MGTTLTGTTPQDTYDSLIKVTDNGPLSGTAKYLSDGLGNDSILALSTARVGLGTNVPSAMLTLNATEPFIRIERTGVPTWQIQNNTLSIDAGFSINNLTNAGTPFFINGTTNNVGIGTTSPTALLHLEKAAQDNVLAVVGQDTYEGALFLSSAGSGKDANIVIGNSRSLIFYSTANSTPAARGTRILTIDSQGIKFGTDTAAANALDDYEEGTFTPSVAYSTSGAPTYATQFGRYTKIGRTVQVQIYLSFNENGAVGDVQISGLPFTSVNSTARAIPSVLSFGLTGLPTAVSVTGFVNSNATTINLFLNDNAATSLSSTYTDADQDIYVTVTYEAA